MSTYLTREDIIRRAYELLGLVLTDQQLQNLNAAFSNLSDPFDLTIASILSNDGLDLLSRKSIDLHLYLIHNARLKMVRHLLPPGDIILDLGGANAPIYRMGYPHPFHRLILIDLPAAQRHEEFQEVELETVSGGGEVIIRYEDMTSLRGIGSESVDFVWSGQSIEHVSAEGGKRMCAEAFRVLKRGGTFCLDTPNRLLTRLHTAGMGGGFIHPDHKVEYEPDELRRLVVGTGFAIKEEWGICEMPLTVKSRTFDYNDFIVGGALSPNIEDSYIQFFHCFKA